MTGPVEKIEAIAAELRVEVDQHFLRGEHQIGAFLTEDAAYLAGAAEELRKMGAPQ